MSAIVNKVKEALHHDKHEGTHEGEHGHHNSKVANAADPRIDSDRDHRAAPGHTTAGHTTAGHSTTGHSTTGHSTTGAGNFGSGPAQNTAGPHNSDMLNKVDPRVDSDLDGSRRVGATGTSNTGTGGLMGNSATTGHQGIGHQQHAHATTGNTGALGGTTGGFGGSTGATGGYGSTTGTSGVTGFNDPEGTHGPHGNRAMNALDPRVDSDRDHRGTAATSGFGTGPASNTAGPHKSDMLNKADPRVDSDLDGSRTAGGNKTFQAAGQQSSGLAGARDPTDAAQVPPSVLQQHIGAPTIHHDDHEHHRERRNSQATHQDNFRGI